MSSPSKDITQASQPGTESSPGGEKQPVKVDGDNTPAATSNAQAPAVSTPPSGEKSAPGTVPDPEKVPPPANTTTIEDEPVDVDPEAPVDDAGDAQEKRRKIKLFIIHTRLARFFAWILLLSFVILPGTFKGDSSDSVKNSPLFVIGLLCCLANACAVSWLWHQRKDDPEWLFMNLFFAGLVNAFSGLVTTFVSIYGAHDHGANGAATKAALALTSVFTIIYAILTLVYYRKREQIRLRRSRRSRRRSSTNV